VGRFPGNTRQRRPPINRAQHGTLKPFHPQHPSLCRCRVSFKGMRVNLAADVTPLERAVAIAPREGKMDPRQAFWASFFLLPSRVHARLFVATAGRVETNRQVNVKSVGALD
jgi:hypothetical protein